jgi:D-psicose/D-tagatose/L-ribulose 3-epimerase
MKFGVNTWVWFSPLTLANLRELLPRLVEAGFDLVELPIETVNAFDYQAVSVMLHDYGLGVSACAVIGPDRDLIHPTAEIRQQGAAYVRHCIEAAEILGAANLIGPLYSAVGRTWQASPAERAGDIDLLVDQLQPLAGYAADHGVTLCLEPLNRFETSLINLAAQAVDVIDRVAHPNCGLMLDTFHMNIEEASPGAAIRLAGKRLKHLHTCENDRGVPGSGHFPWGEMAQALRDIDYQGPVVIESFSAEVKSIAKAAAVWRALAESQDAIAFAGLKFLKQLLA